MRGLPRSPYSDRPLSLGTESCLPAEVRERRRVRYEPEEDGEPPLLDWRSTIPLAAAVCWLGAVRAVGLEGEYAVGAENLKVAARFFIDRSWR